MKSENMTMRAGMTLMEIMVAIGIFSILSMGITSLVIISFQSNANIWDQLQSQHDARRVIQQFVADIRRAESSSVGGFPLATTTAYEISFFANVDAVGYRERVRYFIENGSLKRGIIVPSGTPLLYTSENETVTTLADYVVNESLGTPLFTYYSSAFSGTETALTQPVAAGDVTVVRMNVQIEKDPAKSPIPFSVETVVQVRNLKAN